MAKKAAKSIKFSLNSVALESKLKTVEMNVKQETPTVEALASVGPEKIVGNYDWTEKIDGQFDGATGGQDATVFGLVGSAGQTALFEPTGVAAGSGNDPNYSGTAILTDYSIKGQVGGAVEFTATLDGNSALTRTA